MGRRQKPLNPDNPLHVFAGELRALANAAGERGRQKATTALSKSTYYAWMNGDQLPHRDLLDVVVRFWGGDVTHWATRCGETADALGRNTAAQSIAEPVSTSEGSRTTDVASQRINEMRGAMRKLGVEWADANQQSALALLALMQLDPDSAWGEARTPILRIADIINWANTEYKMNYRPNTRESIRRHVQKLVALGLVVQNPDDPSRTHTSSRWSYQISQAAFEQLAPLSVQRLPNLAERKSLTPREGRSMSGGPYEGVPGHIRSSLYGWLNVALFPDFRLIRQVATACGLRITAGYAGAAEQEVRQFIQDDPEMFLDVLHGTVQLRGQFAAQLNQILEDGDSVWRATGEGLHRVARLDVAE